MLLELDHEFFGYFVHPEPECSYWYEDIQNKTDLLVTIGDSWTWGDSIGTTRASKNISDPNRVNLVYGRHLQKSIDSCDWINIGFPGIENRWIVDVAERFIDLSKKLTYKKIWISIGLTDITRDLTKRAWEGPPSPVIDKIKYYENALFTKINKIESESRLQVVVGRNFTNTVFEDHQKMIKNHLPLRWVDVSADTCGLARPPFNVGYHMPPDITEDDKKWALETMFPNASLMTDYLLISPLHYKEASKHPTEKCHKVWAEYIFDYFKQHCMI